HMAPVAEKGGPSDVHGPEVAGPRVDVAEQMPVECLEVGDVVVARHRPEMELVQPGGDDVGLGSKKLIAVVDAEEVDQDAGLSIDVRVDAQRRWRVTDRSTSSSASSSPASTATASRRNSGVGSSPS